MPDLYKNFSYTTVATAPSPATSGTSLVVAAGTGGVFPVAPFNAVVWPAGVQPTNTNAEIVRVTARATDTLTITRTQESTSARSIAVGDQISAAITAKFFTETTQQVYDIRSYGAVGDGLTGSATANTTAITAAAAAASAAGGGRVFIPAGVFRITNLLTFTSLTGVSFSGVGVGSSVIEYDVNDTDGILFTTCTRIILRDITFRHKAAQTTRTTSQNLRFYQSTDAVVQDCEFKYSKSIALTFEQTTNVRCERNYAHDVLADGIHVNTPKGTNIIAGNRVESCEDDLIAVWNYTALVQAAGTYSVTIEGNKLATSTGTGVSSGIKVGGLEDFVIRGNTIRGTNASAISLVKSLVAGIETGACRNAVISGNVCVNNNIQATAAPYAAIEVVNFNSGGVGVLTVAHENVAITGNTVDGANDMGIYASALRGLTLTGNTILNPNRANVGLPYPIEVAGVTAGSVTGNVISYTSGTTTWSVHVNACTDLRVIGNHGNGFASLYHTSALVDGTNTRVYVDATGPGTPEGSVTNPPGSVWHRTDGGAATSLYVKETGTAATGWVGK